MENANLHFCTISYHLALFLYDDEYHSMARRDWTLQMFIKPFQF